VEEIFSLCGINSSSVFQILTRVLKLRKVCARWIPHLLTEDQKRQRVRIAPQLLDIYKNADQNRMNEIVTGDETWVYFYEPDSKEENKCGSVKMTNGPRLPVELAPQNALCMHYFLIAREWWLEFLYQKAGVLLEYFTKFGSFCCCKPLYCIPSPYRRTRNQAPS